MTLQDDYNEVRALRQIVTGLAVAVIILAIGLVVVVVHILDRQNKADHRNKMEQEAICSLIDGVPASQSTPQVVTIRVGYDCGPPHAPFVVTSPSP